MRYVLKLGVLLLMSATTSLAQDEDGGDRSVFAYGAGNRALALGGAFSAIADDASAAVWNPGGLGFVNRRQLQGSHSNLIGIGFSEQYVSLAMPSWRWGVTSLTVRHLGVGEIESRDDRNLLIDDGLSSHDTEIMLAYGRQLSPAWGIGGAIKMQQQSLAGFSDSGLGLDLGVLVRPVLMLHEDAVWADRVSLGVSVRNLIEPSIRLVEDEVADPTGLRVGVAYRHPFREQGFILTSFDVEKTGDASARLHGGFEIRPLPMLALRTGFSAGTPLAGAGVRWRDMSFDYVYESNELGAVHRVGLELAFGSTTEERQRTYYAREEARIQDRLAEAFETRSSARVEQLLSEAKSELRAGNYDKGLATLSKVTVLDPDEPRARKLEVRTLYEKGLELEVEQDYAAAAVVFGQATTISPENTNIAQALDRVRREGDRRATRSLEIRKYFQAGLDAFVTGDLMQSRKYFARVVERDPQDEDARSMLLRTEEAIRLRSSNLVTQARTLVQANLLDDAEAFLTEARGLDPSASGLADVDRQIKTARRLQAEDARRAEADRRARESAAQSSTEDVVEVIEEPAVPALTEAERREMGALYRRGITAVEEGRVEDAIRYWEFVWSTDPTFEQVGANLKREYLARGMESFAAGKLSDAITDWESALQVDPEDARARGYLGRAHQELARYQKILSETRVATRE